METLSKVDDIMYLSPSSINDYFRCPYFFFKSHIEKVPIKKTIHLVKGTVVHNSLEKWFMEYTDDLVKGMEDIFNREWEINPELKDLKLPDEELVMHKKDAWNIVTKFVTRHLDKIEGIIDAGKAENYRHAWYLLRPKLNEVKLEVPEMKVRGKADRVYENFDGLVTLGDYKTSNRYGIGITEDQRRQIAIYALMYLEQEKKPLHFVSIIFLRFGEEPMLEVTPDLIKFGRDTVLYVREKTMSRNIDDYPKKLSSNCQNCALLELCSGAEEFVSKLRKEKFKKLAEKLK